MFFEKFQREIFFFRSLKLQHCFKTQTGQGEKISRVGFKVKKEKKGSEQKDKNEKNEITRVSTRNEEVKE